MTAVDIRYAVYILGGIIEDSVDRAGGGGGGGGERRVGEEEGRETWEESGEQIRDHCAEEEGEDSHANVEHTRVEL
jgi:hypothetical protein